EPEPGRGWFGYSLLSQRLSLHGAGSVHGDLSGDAAGRSRGHKRAGGPKPTLARFGACHDPGHGFAGGHSAARGLFWKVPAAQIYPRSSAVSSRFLFPGIYGSRGYRNFPVLLFWSGARDLLVGNSAEFVRNITLFADSTFALQLPCGDLFSRLVPG